MQALTTPSQASSTLPALSETEQKILQVKYKSRVIGLLSPEELTLCLPSLLIRISTITGWVLPTGLAYKVLESEFGELLQEQYQDVNPDEIAYAFRSSGYTVKEYGKALNLSLINEVMKPYLDKRLDTSHAEERLKAQQDDGFLKSRSNDWFRAIIQQSYSLFTRGIPVRELNLHSHAYEILVQDGFIQPGFYKELLRIYQRRLLHSDGVLSRAAKVKSVHKLFRLFKKENKTEIYARAK